MKKNAFLYLFVLVSFFTCCKKEEPQEYKPSANFIMYESVLPGWGYYWEYIDRDTFQGGSINFEATDTTKGIEYEWQIGIENIKGKRRVSRDFSNVPDKSNIPIELRVHYPGKRSDTIIRKFYLTKDPNYPTIFKQANWIFVNDKDQKDTFRIKFHRKSSSGNDKDTLYLNDCKRYVEKLDYTTYEMAISGTTMYENYYSCTLLPNIKDFFISLDNSNKNKATLKIKIGINNQWVPQTFTGYTIK